MAIRLIDAYPVRANAANENYPHGSGRNKTASDATDGTPFDEARFNDQEAFFQSLVEAAGVTPNNTVDTVPTSQYADALTFVANGVVEIDVAGSTDRVVNYNERRAGGVRLTGALLGHIDLVVPNTARLYTVINDTTGAFTITVKTALGAGVVVAQGLTDRVRSDGIDVVPAIGTAAVGSMKIVTINGTLALEEI